MDMLKWVKLYLKNTTKSEQELDWKEVKSMGYNGPTMDKELVKEYLFNLLTKREAKLLSDYIKDSKIKSVIKLYVEIKITSGVLGLRKYAV